MRLYNFVTDLLRQVANVLQPANGGTGSTYGEQRTVVPALNLTGSDLVLNSLVQWIPTAKGRKVRNVTTANAASVLGVVVGYYDATGQLVEADAADQSTVAVQVAGIVDILIESTVSNRDYAFSAATDGTIQSSGTIGTGAFGVVLGDGDTSHGVTMVPVQLGVSGGGGGGGGGAPSTAKYITQTPDAGLSAEQALSALATGMVKNTTTTGVLSIGTEGTDYYKPGGTDVAVADGGTGSSTASAARTALGLAIGADVQAWDADLDALAGLAIAADTLPYGNGSHTMALATLTAFIRTLLDDTDAITARATLGVIASLFEAGGAQAIPLDTLDTPTDITTLNATTSHHGLLPKLPGGTATFLRADGNYAGPGASLAGGGTAIYGDGSDGSVNMDGTNTYTNFATTTGSAPNRVYTLTRNVYATDFTVASGKTLNTGGFSIQATGTLTNAGTINNAGGDASGATVGTTPTNTSVTYFGGFAAAAGRSTAGAGGGTNPGASKNFGGDGGNGGTAGTGTGGTATAVTPLAVYNIRTIAAAMTCQTPIGNASPFTGLVRGGNGGAAGGVDTSGGTSGGGGGGGGCMALVARTISNSGTVTVKGGVGGTAPAGFAGGGGGGGGGVLWLVYDSYSNSGTVTVAGGAGGAGHGGGASGATSNDGTLIQLSNV